MSGSHDQTSSPTTVQNRSSCVTASLGNIRFTSKAHDNRYIQAFLSVIEERGFEIVVLLQVREGPFACPGPHASTRRYSRVSARLSCVSSRGAVCVQAAPVMPYSLGCFLFGSSSIPFSTFALGTAIGVCPYVLFFVLMGLSMNSLEEAASGNVHYGGR